MAVNGIGNPPVPYVNTKATTVAPTQKTGDHSISTKEIATTSSQGNTKNALDSNSQNLRTRTNIIPGGVHTEVLNDDDVMVFEYPSAAQIYAKEEAEKADLQTSENTQVVDVES